jgi:NitT/TauT family transport system ATP-binding protein
MVSVANAPAVADVPVAAFEPGPAGTHITIRGLTKYFAGWPLYEGFDLNIDVDQHDRRPGADRCRRNSV